jgi:RNA polymerase sigma-70 factor (ECF subfamily)
MSETSPADSAAIARSRQEPEVFGEIFRRHAAEIKRFVIRRLGLDVAEDVVAQTFLAAFQQRGRYDLARHNALPWLYGIATNLIGRHKRTEATPAHANRASVDRSSQASVIHTLHDPGHGLTVDNVEDAPAN